MKLSVKDSGHRSKYSDYYKEKNKMGKRRVGRPRKKKRADKKKTTGRRRLPTRVKTGKNKGRFKKRG